MSTEFYLRRSAESLEKLVKQGEKTPLPPVCSCPSWPCAVHPKEPYVGSYQEAPKGPHTCQCGSANLWCPTHVYQCPYKKVSE